MNTKNIAVQNSTAGRRDIIKKIEAMEKRINRKKYLKTKDYNEFHAIKEEFFKELKKFNKDEIIQKTQKYVCADTCRYFEREKYYYDRDDILYLLDLMEKLLD